MKYPKGGIISYELKNTSGITMPVGHWVKEPSGDVNATGYYVPVRYSFEEVYAMVEKEARAVGFPYVFYKTRREAKAKGSFEMQVGIKFQVETDEEHEYLVTKGDLTSWSSFFPIDTVMKGALATIAGLIFEQLQKDYIKKLLWRYFYVRFYV